MTVIVNVQATGGFSHFWSSFYNQLANSPIADGSGNGVHRRRHRRLQRSDVRNEVRHLGNRLTYSGSFPNIHLTSGTITAIEVRDAPDNVLATFTGFNIPAATFNSAMATYVTGHGPSPGGDGNPDASGSTRYSRPSLTT